MKVHVVLKGANYKAPSVCDHHVDSDDDVDNNRKRVHAPGLREHIHIFVPFLGEW